MAVNLNGPPSASGTLPRSPRSVTTTPNPAHIPRTAMNSATRPPRPNSIIVNASQTGNPVLKCIRNVSWEFGETVVDYEVGKRAGVLFLSLQFHKLHSNYIYERLKLLGSSYQLRILLVLVDIPNHEAATRELTRVSVLLDFAVVLCWGAEEAGRYLETLKAFEFKSADLLRERKSSSRADQVTDCLTNIKSVNKTDCLTLLANFATFADMVNADRAALSQCPGFGEQKIKRFLATMDEPFMMTP